MNEFYEEWMQPEERAISEEKRIFTRIADSKMRIGWDPHLQVPFFEVEVQTTWQKNELARYTTKGMSVEKEGKWLHIQLKNIDSVSLFIKMCHEIIEHFRKGKLVDDATRTVLIEYISFFKNDNRTLSLEKQMGLYGELLLLEKLLKAYPKDMFGIIEGWKGPTRSYHDFQYRGKCIEVKCTRSKNPVKVTISNEKQLDRMSLEELWLNAYSFVIVAGEDSLPKIIQRIEKRLNQSAGIKTFRRMLDVFCQRSELETYDTGYSLSKCYWFTVNDKFPAITDTPKAVGRISYDVLINEIDDSCLANEEAVFKEIAP